MYYLHFPIYWFEQQPYAVFDGNQGIVPSSLLFFRPSSSGDANYSIQFAPPLKATNSAFGKSERFVLLGEELFETYFVFGNYVERCFVDDEMVRLHVIADKDTLWESGYCSSLRSLWYYYLSEFGTPITLNGQATIAFFNAKSLGSSHSGFYAPRVDMPYIAHEMFHMWQDEKCSNDLFFKEGLATYMQVDALQKARIIDEDERNKILEDFKKALLSVDNLDSAYFYSKENLYALREESPQSYQALVYFKGALLWEMLSNKGYDVNQLFRQYQSRGDCPDRLLAQMEKHLYSNISHQQAAILRP